MLRYVAKRLAIGIGTIWAAFTLTFLLVHSSDSSPGLVRSGLGATEEEVEAENERLGWNRPLLTQYVDDAGSIVRFDLGQSLINRNDVGPELADRLPVTASISVLATLLAGVAGTGLGVMAAVRGGRVARAVNLFAGLSLSLPSFWLGVVLVYFFAIRYDILPSTGYSRLSDGAGDWLRSLALPVITLAIGGAAVVARMAATGMREALAREHITTLRAVGTPEWRIRYVHALRAASLPVIGVLGVQFIVLFGGSVIIENLFALPGLGQAALTGATSNDFPILIGVVVLSTAVVVVTNLVLDLLTAVLDPKLRTQ
jgi:peptide/nickel transport system permease protein